jgi:hypothetical protein
MDAHRSTGTNPISLNSFSTAAFSIDLLKKKSSMNHVSLGFHR